MLVILSRLRPFYLFYFAKPLSPRTGLVERLSGVVERNPCLQRVGQPLVVLLHGKLEGLAGRGRSLVESSSFGVCGSQGIQNIWPLPANKLVRPLGGSIASAPFRSDARGHVAWSHAKFFWASASLGCVTATFLKWFNASSNRPWEARTVPRLLWAAGLLGSISRAFR